MPSFLTLEHVGSTAVPGCGGKGVIDVLALYRDGSLEAAKAYLLELGFGRQGAEFANPWPASRPMYLGAYRWSGHPFLIYCHVVSSASEEVRRFREFRDRLTGDPALVADYCTAKRTILADGVRDTGDYAVRRRPVILRILGNVHALRPPADREPGG